MSTIPYKQPAQGETSFNCPFCNAFAQQIWNRTGRIKLDQFAVEKVLKDHYISTCDHCSNSALWIAGRMIHPLAILAPLPNADMPDNVKADYEEARQVLTSSPRSAAALLRLATQKLCVHLGEDGKNINDNIASLVKKGLPEKLQKAWDSLRIVGNNAVHPGYIDLTDNVELATKMFGLLNIICDSMITKQKEIDEIYNMTIPEHIKDDIDKRDGKK